MDSFPLPTLEELLTKITGNCFFTRTDRTSAYNQLKVTPESALAQALITPFGLYQVNVLNFGVASAQ